tara:strand:+ start:270 stop:479 length:210 start_codon:yes stop_codon:yes gene_type:complete
MTKKQLDIMKTWLMEVLDEAWATAAREERQKVVTWLRGPMDGVIEEACLVAAAMIERGEHVKEVTDGTS